MTNLLARDEALHYWDRRHRVEGPLRSGGNVGLDAAVNEVFYAVRLGSLLQLLGGAAGSDGPLFVLDAGCGKGYFSGFLAHIGHEVTGIDTSATAIEYCRRTHGGSYQVASLDQFRASALFDAVFSIDVLFHILDDDLWESAVVNLARHVRLGGRLIVTDLPVAVTEARGNYILHRPLGRYQDLLGELGLEMVRREPYDFRGNHIEFLTYGRVG